MWMTMDEIAEYLKVSKETIYKMAQKGHIPGSKIGSQWRFRKERVDSWLESHSNEVSPDHTSTSSTTETMIDEKKGT